MIVRVLELLKSQILELVEVVVVMMMGTNKQLSCGEPRNSGSVTWFKSDHVMQRATRVALALDIRTFNVVASIASHTCLAKSYII